MLGVAHLNEVEPLRRRGHAGTGAVAFRKHFPDPGDLTLTASHLQQTPYDVAHHVLQEGIGLDLHGYQGSRPPNIDPLNHSTGMSGLASGCAETAEVMLAEQLLSSLAHALDIEWARHAGDAIPEQSLPRAVVGHQIEVAAPACGEPRVEAFISGHGPMNADTGVGQGVTALDPIFRRPRGSSVEVNHLTGGMNARIRAPGTDQPQGPICNATESGFEVALHRQALGRCLSLESVEAATIVFDAKHPARHGSHNLNSINPHSAQAGKQFGRFLLLAFVTVTHHFVEDLLRAIFIAHVDVGTRQFEFGGGFVARLIEAHA